MLQEVDPADDTQTSNDTLWACHLSLGESKIYFQGPFHMIKGRGVIHGAAKGKKRSKGVREEELKEMRKNMQKEGRKCM